MTKKFEPTPEQKAKADERRRKFRELCGTISKMSDPERLALASKCLAVNVEGHTLSPSNKVLIAYQFDGATIVGGFNQWLKQGRHVKKGESGITIWVPVKNGAKKEEGKEDAATGFFMGTIFDVSQTEETVKQAAE